MFISYKSFIPDGFLCWDLAKKLDFGSLGNLVNLTTERKKILICYTFILYGILDKLLCRPELYLEEYLEDLTTRL